ncbi:hypothetical protein Tsubulata_038460 [Turnera subulata]|uniref:Cornichon n=1 Tax=Turnera subulata TaxID=218843 RepID=A0A9Q0G4D5_9ROSI|nr:hypothetical protein Tsubulata_038460 [Turnera subulata]
MEQLVSFYDLEFDHLNPYDLASRSIKFVLAEYFGLGLICVIYLLAGHWFMCLLSLPHLFYNVKTYLQRRHLIDITEIYNQLEKHKQLRMYKLGHLLSLTLMTLFWVL